MAKYAIGIDLGTTNCALSAAPLDDKDAVPEALGVPQVVHAGEVAPQPLLPSFLYLPGEVELPAGAVALPWDADRGYAVGAFAREQGASVPARLVSSAKSWLSHAGVDRRSAILPWGAPDEVPRLSPLEASARYLQHLREAWDAAHPDEPLAAQELVVTVPASFDAIARELTVEAAAMAGLGDLTLLEEPQAALYSWVATHGPTWRKQVTVGDLILVCDIGGGTTDFSLIAVRESDGQLELERVAVGDHILLGGDNMDLALAYAVRARLEAAGTRLDDWQMRALTYGCRLAKEVLFTDTSKDEFPLVVPGRGSKLIGGAIRTSLTRQELVDTLLDGFFPVVGADARPQAPRRTGLTAIGLPYASDAGMTRHLAAFLGRTKMPSAILFNGGVTRSPIIRDRILGVLQSWVGKTELKVLEGVDPDLAVSRGASYYARVRSGGGVRIRGGTARAYYVGIERAELAVPGVPPRVDAVCIAPFGMEEGTEIELPQTFGLVVGEPASFRFFGSAARGGDQIASVVDPGELEELPPIETAMEGDTSGVVPVRLHARVTEIGTLDLSAVEQQGKRRWKLSFNVRVE
jgi:molecular chaperone DnaK (HSP70)